MKGNGGFAAGVDVLAVKALEHSAPSYCLMLTAAHLMPTAEKYVEQLQRGVVSLASIDPGAFFCFLGSMLFPA